MPATDSIPLSSEVARSGTPPPPPPTVDVDNDTDNNNQDDDHGQEDTDYIQTTTSTATQQDNHRNQEHDQSRLDSEADDDKVGEEDDYEDEGDTDWGDDDKDGDDDDSFGEEPDPVYVADLLRQSGIDWMQYPNYATHRIVVTSTAEATGAEGQVPGRQYYRVMAQFLIPGSAVFRDFLLGEDPNTATNDDEEEEEEEDGEEKVFRKERLTCLQDGPFTDSDPSLADNTYFQDPTNAPDIARSLLEPLEPYIYQRYAPYTPTTSSDGDTDPYAHQPWIHLSLLHPEHFPGLLQVIYTMDLDTWEETCFRPETIVGIIETVRRLECYSGLMVRCLEYFRRVEDIRGVEEFEEEREGGLEEVRRLVRAAVEGGMLPPDPGF